MHTLDDYLLWRGDLSFIENPFNEVDNLVLSNLIYVRFTDIFKEFNDTMTIKEVCDKFFLLDPSKQIFRDIKDRDFIKQVAKTRRFKDIKIMYYREIYDTINETQFGALTYDLNDGNYYVAYRGTDNYIAGWKEDFNLTYKIIPSQILAHQYLDEVLSNIKGLKKRVYIGGHSKGGNLGMYAAAHIKQKNFNKIIRIYNNDGPGFNFNLVDKNKFERLKPILITFTPKTSIVASFFEPVGKFTIIDSNEFSLLEHDPYSWLVDVTKFKRVSSVEDASLKTKVLINEWIDNLSYEERQTFANNLYEVIVLSGARNLNDIVPSLTKDHRLVQKYLKSLDEKTRRTFMSAISLLFTSISSSVGDNFKNMFKKD